MLTRRGFASCALCAISGFIATEASAQGTPPAAAGGRGGGESATTEAFAPARSWYTGGAFLERARVARCFR